MKQTNLLISIALTLFLVIFITSHSFSADKTFKENFAGGKTELKWSFFPFFNLDNLHPVIDPKAPDGDSGIGVLNNSNAGGFASLSYAVTDELTNFYFEAMVFCPVTDKPKGPLSGIAFLIDPIRGAFYRIACDFKLNDPSINLAYVALETRNYPVFLRFWNLNEIPGGIPEKSSWNKVGVRVKDGKATIFWNNKKLPGNPIHVDRIKKGFIGVYTNFVGGFGYAETRVDQITVVIED